MTLSDPESTQETTVPEGSTEISPVYQGSTKKTVPIDPSHFEESQTMLNRSDLKTEKIIEESDLKSGDTPQLRMPNTKQSALNTNWGSTPSHPDVAARNFERIAEDEKKIDTGQTPVVEPLLSTPPQQKTSGNIISKFFSRFRKK